MRKCKQNKDCRKGYQCIKPEENNSEVIDKHKANVRYCI
jgi:hypothetical protein